MTYVMVQASPGSALGRQYYGGAREFWRYQGMEAILSGPFETGKTVCALDKLHHLICKYSGARALMIRKTYASLVQSAIVTYEKKVLPFSPDHPKSGISKYGGEKPEFYDYPNGSRLVCAGLDKPGKVLSSEYDFIYVNQAEELALAEWETLTGRATGRAGNAPYTQVMGDCNPDVPTHWILHRKTLKLFEQRHEHNPTLFDQATGAMTAQGKRTIKVLDALTGVRHKRGRKGLWVGAEGLVYDDFDKAVHVIPRFEIPKQWTRYRVIDFGYNNPFVCQWWAVDHDGRMYLYREIYMTKRTVKVHARDIFRHQAGLSGPAFRALVDRTAKESDLVRELNRRADSKERIFQTVADHDAEDRATLAENGIPTVPAKKGISRGIQAVQERLKIQGDGKPRIFFLEDSLVEADPALYREYPGDTQPVCTEQEFAAYSWPDGKDGKPNKEQPIDMFNHGMDCTLYQTMHLDGGAKIQIGRAPKITRNYRG